MYMPLFFYIYLNQINECGRESDNLLFEFLVPVIHLKSIYIKKSVSFILFQYIVINCAITLCFSFLSIIFLVLYCLVFKKSYVSVNIVLFLYNLSKYRSLDEML